MTNTKNNESLILYELRTCIALLYLFPLTDVHFQKIPSQPSYSRQIMCIRPASLSIVTRPDSKLKPIEAGNLCI